MITSNRNNAKYYDVVVSYADRSELEINTTIIENIVYFLKANNLSVFYAKKSLDGGENWRAKYTNAAKNCKLVIVMCTQAALRSKFVLDELTVADNYNKKIIPLLIDDFVQNNGYPEDFLMLLQSSQWVDVYSSETSEWMEYIKITLEKHDIHVKLSENAYPLFDSIDIEKIAMDLRFIENRPNSINFGTTLNYSVFKKLVYSFHYAPIAKIPEQCIYVLSGLPGVGKTTQLLSFCADYLKRNKRDCKACVYLNPLYLQTALEEIQNYDLSSTIFVIDALHRRENDETFLQKCEILVDFVFRTKSRFIITIRDHEADKLNKFLTEKGLSQIIQIHYVKPNRQVIPYIVLNYLECHSIDIYDGKISYSEALALLNSLDKNPTKNSFQIKFIEAMNIVVNKSEGVPYYVSYLVNALIEKKESFNVKFVKTLPCGVTNFMLDTFERVFNNKVIISLFICLSRLEDFSTPTLDLFFKQICKHYQHDGLNKNELKYQLEEFHRRFCLIVDDSTGDLQRLPSYWIDTINLCLESNIQNYDNYEVIKLMKNWAYEVDIENFIDNTFKKEIEMQITKSNRRILLIASDAAKRKGLVDFLYQCFLNYFNHKSSSQDIASLKKIIISQLLLRARKHGNKNIYEKSINDFAKILYIDESNIKAWCNKIDAMRVSDYNNVVKKIESEISLIEKSLHNCEIEDYILFLNSLINIDFSLADKYGNWLENYVASSQAEDKLITNQLDEMNLFSELYKILNDSDAIAELDVRVDSNLSSIDFRFPRKNAVLKNIITNPHLLWECSCRLSSPDEYCKIHTLPAGNQIANTFGSHLTRIEYDDTFVYWLEAGDIWPPSFDSLNLARCLKVNEYDKKKYDTVLDLGCGTGFLGIYLRKINPHIQKICMSDWNVNACRLAEYNIRRNSLDLDDFSVKAGAGFRPFKNEHFDLAIVQPPYLPHFDVFSSNLSGSSNGTELLQTSILKGKDYTDELIISFSEIALQEFEQCLQDVRAHKVLLAKEIIPFRVPHAVKDTKYVEMLIAERGLKVLNKEGFPYWHEIYTYSIKFY